MPSDDKRTGNTLLAGSIKDSEGGEGPRDYSSAKTDSESQEEERQELKHEDRTSMLNDTGCGLKGFTVRISRRLEFEMNGTILTLIKGVTLEVLVLLLLLAASVLQRKTLASILAMR